MSAATTLPQGHADSTFAVAAGCLSAAAMGVLIVYAPLALVAIAVVVFGGLILPFWPRLGFYLAYPIFFFLPLDRLRITDLPILSSLLNFLVITSAVVGVVHWSLRPRRLPGARLYLPLLLASAVLIANVAVRNPTAGLIRLSSLLLAMWPFALTILLIQTPAHAGRILRVALGCVVGFSAVWLPLLLAIGGEAGESSAQSLARQVSISFAGGRLTLNYLLVLTFATAVPVFVALAWYPQNPGRTRILGAVSTALVLTALISSGYAAAPLGAVIGASTVPLVAVVSDRRQRAGAAVLRVGLVWIGVLGLVLAFFFTTPQGQVLVNRIVEPEQDFSAAYRLYASQQGLLAFLANPLVGWGPFNEATSRAGYLLGGHSTYIKAAYEYGLAFLVPFLWLLVEMVRLPLRLVPRATRSIDRSLLVGITGALVVILALGFVTEVFDGVIPLSLVWLFVGLAAVWQSWLERDSSALLVR